MNAARSHTVSPNSPKIPQLMLMRDPHVVPRARQAPEARTWLRALEGPRRFSFYSAQLYV